MNRAVRFWELCVFEVFYMHEAKYEVRLNSKLRKRGGTKVVAKFLGAGDKNKLDRATKKCLGDGMAKKLWEGKQKVGWPKILG